MLFSMRLLAVIQVNGENKGVKNSGLPDIMSVGNIYSLRHFAVIFCFHCQHIRVLKREISLWRSEDTSVFCSWETKTQSNKVLFQLFKLKHGISEKALFF